jgi:hypothetical protein
MSKKDKTEKTNMTETTEKRIRTPFADKTIEDNDKYLIVETRTLADCLGEKIKVKAYRVTNKVTGQIREVRNIRKAFAWLTSIGAIKATKGTPRTADPKISLLRAAVLFTDRAMELAKSFGEDCPVDFERLNKWIAKMEKATNVTADSIRDSAAKAREANKASRDKKIAAAKAKDVQ